MWTDPPAPTADPWEALIAENLRDPTRHRAVLTQDPDRWYRALVVIQQSIQAQFADRRAKALAHKNACLADGPDGKRAWFRFQAEEEAWRGKAQFKLRVVLDRQRDAKRLRAEHYLAERETRTTARHPDPVALAAHRERLAALVTDDAAWTTSLVSKATRVRLRGVLGDLDRLLARAEEEPA
jgi:hypothetical protein